MNYFDEFCVNYLSTKCREIENDDNMAMISQTTDAYERILRFAQLGINEGLLALEMASEELDKNDESQAFFYTMMKLIVDGVEPGIVQRIGMNKCVATNLPSYQGLVNLMYVQGSLMIQNGDNILVIKEMLDSMMPRKLKK